MEIEIRPFIKVFEDTTRKFKKIPKGNYLGEGRFPIIDQSQEFIAGYTDDESLVNFDNIPVIIFGDHTRSLKYINFPIALGADGAKALNLKDEGNNAKFLYYALKNLELPNVGYSRHFKFLKESNFPIPKDPLNQKRIAQVLSDCEALIAKRKESIELLDELVKSTFLEMFGDPVVNQKKFELVPLQKLGTIDRGVSKHRPRNAPELLGGEHPLIQTGDVSNAGTYITEYSRTYSDIGLSQSKKWPVGTLCITIAANIAKTGILTFKACFPDSVVGFVVNKKSNNLYIHSLFSFLQRILEKNAPAAAQKNINLNILRNLNVPKPPIELQKEFADIVKKIEETKELYQSHLTELENLYARLSQDAFKGELDLSGVVLRDEFLGKDEPGKFDPPNDKNNPQNEIEIIEQQIENKVSYRETINYSFGDYVERDFDKKSKTEKKLNKAEIQKVKQQLKPKKRKRDITNLSLTDYLGIPKDLQAKWDKIDFDFISDDLFYQFALKNVFKINESFSYQDIETKMHNYFYHGGDMDVPYESWKEVIFKFIEQKPPLVEQFFDENDGEVKLKLTDEAFKA